MTCEVVPFVLLFKMIIFSSEKNLKIKVVADFLKMLSDFCLKATGIAKTVVRIVYGKSSYLQGFRRFYVVTQ